MAIVSLLAVLLLQASGAQAKTSPVTKIVNMLKEMTAQLQKEQEADNEMMETMKCWCETYDKEKTAAILAAEDSIATLKTVSEENGAAAAQFTAEIASLESHLAESENALAQATEQRKKRLAEFNEEEKDLLGSITSVKDAIISLEKHHSSASLLQEATGSKGALDATHSIAMMVKTQLRKHDSILSEVITPHQRKVVASLLRSGTSLMQSPEDYFAAVAAVGVRLPRSMQKFMSNKQLMQLDEVPGGKYYQSASGEIFGILKQMKESFEQNLNSAQVEETSDNKEFEDMKNAKTTEIAATQASLDEKNEALGQASFKKAKADQDEADTQEILAADTEYLAMLKSTCATADADFELRRKTRIEESTAVTKALAFLQSDEAQDLFHASLGAASFIQKKSLDKLRAGRVAGAANILKKAAHSLNRPVLSALAVKVRIDAFDKAKKQIQAMIDQLTKESADEVKKKDMCIAEINSNEASAEAATRDKDEAIEKVEALTATIDNLAKEIADLKTQVADGQTALKRAGEDRELENKDFQLTVADQRATQKVLTAALDILKGFYDKAALLQSKKQEPYVAGPAPPTAFKSYEKQSSGGVTGAIEGVIADSKSVEAEAIQAESDAQQAYENLTKDTNDSIDEMVRSITTKTEFKAQCESDKVETEQSRDSAIETLEELANENTALHADCDYTLKNFDLRQGARGSEIEALKQALVFLSGGSFKSLLQGEDVTPQMQVNDEVQQSYNDYRKRLEDALP
jgi:hypothetical protein